MELRVERAQGGAPRQRDVDNGLLLRRVRPSLAVISAGTGNQFGHPHGEVLSRLADESDPTVVLRTDVDGRIRLRSEGVSLTYRSVR